MSVNLEENVKRVERAENEIQSLIKQIGELKKIVESTNSSVDPKVAGLLAENEKLRYRLNILKRAASNKSKKLTLEKKIVTMSSTNGKSLPIIQNVLYELFKQAINEEYPNLTEVPILIALSNNPKFGDYQCNSAMPINALLKGQGIKTNPKEIAEKIKSRVFSLMEKNPFRLIENIEVQGGFINILLSKAEGQRYLQLVLKHGVVAPVLSSKRRVLIDFSSPNIAKEMHFGHLRSTIIGESICRLLEYLGHDVIRINHVGDWDTQFGMLIAHLQDKFPDYLNVSPPIQDLQLFCKESKKRFDEDEEFKKRAYECVAKLQARHPDYIKAWNLICDVSRKEFQKVYDRLGVKVIERGESFYQSRMESLVKELEERGFLENDEGRKIMWGEGASIPFTIIKSDGGFTYDTCDMAAIKQRIEEEKADWLIYVTDAGQKPHFDILQRCAKRCGILDPDKVRVDFVGFSVVLGEDKKKFKTRSGDTVRLIDLLEEGLKRALDKLKEKERFKDLTPEELKAAQESVAYGCIKYADLSHNRNHEYVFSFDKMLEDKGNTAVYLLNALNKIKSIARIGEQQKKACETTPISLNHPKEWKLGKVLLKFPDVLSTITKDLCLHHLCDFVYEIACAFTEFYNNCHCIEKNQSGEVVKLHMNRILLCEVTALIMEKCFHILGLKPVAISFYASSKKPPATGAAAAAAAKEDEKPAKEEQKKDSNFKKFDLASEEKKKEEEKKEAAAAAAREDEKPAIKEQKKDSNFKKFDLASEEKNKEEEKKDSIFEKLEEKKDSDFGKIWKPLKLKIDKFINMPLSDVKRTKIVAHELVQELLPLMDDIKKNKEASEDYSKVAQILVPIMYLMPSSLKEAATHYFKEYFGKQNKELEGDFKFTPKVAGDQIGGKMTAIFKEGGYLAYYIKTHQYGSNVRNSTAKPVDPKELLVYKILEKMGLGPKAHFFFFRFGEGGLLIATQDCCCSKDSAKQKSFLTYGKVTETYSRKDLASLYDSINGVAEVDLFSRIFLLNDAITNPSNFGVVTVDKEEHKWKIIDFRTHTRRIYFEAEIYESWLEGDHMFNFFEYTEDVLKNRPEQDRLATAKIIIGKFKEGRLSKKGHRKMSLKNAVMEGYFEISKYVAENAVRIGIRNVPQMIGKWDLDVLKNISLEDFFIKLESMHPKETGDLGRYSKDVLINFETLASKILSESS